MASTAAKINARVITRLIILFSKNESRVQVHLRSSLYTVRLLFVPMTMIFPGRLWYGEKGKKAVALDLDISRILVEGVQISGKFRYLPVSYLLELEDPASPTGKTTKKVALKIVFPRMRSPFPLKPGYDETKPDRVVVVNFANIENSEVLQAFLEMNKAINLHILTQIHNNYEDWFQAASDAALEFKDIEKMMPPLVRDGWSKKENKKFPDMIDLKVRAITSKKTGVPTLQCGFWGQTGKRIELQRDIKLQRNDLVLVGLLDRIYAQPGKLYLKYAAQEVKIYESIDSFEMSDVCRVIEDTETPPNRTIKRLRDADDSDKENQPPEGAKQQVVVDAVEDF